MLLLLRSSQICTNVSPAEPAHIATLSSEPIRDGSILQVSYGTKGLQHSRTGVFTVKDLANYQAINFTSGT